MKISVERLFGPDVQVIEVDQPLRLRDELAARYPDGVRVAGTIRRIQRGVYMEGEVAGREVETCVRCLEPFVREARVQIEEAFSEDVPAHDALIANVAPLVDRAIDISELAEQLLEVDEPIAAVCSEACKGICPHCGVNRNVERCNCRDEQIDERLAGLAKLMQEPGVN